MTVSLTANRAPQPRLIEQRAEERVLIWERQDGGAALPIVHLPIVAATVGCPYPIEAADDLVGAVFEQAGEHQLKNIPRCRRPPQTHTHPHM